MGSCSEVRFGFFGCFVGLRGPCLRKSTSLKPEDGVEDARPSEEANEAMSALRVSMSSVLFEGLVVASLEAAIVVELVKVFAAVQRQGFKKLGEIILGFDQVSDLQTHWITRFWIQYWA